MSNPEHLRNLRIVRIKDSRHPRFGQTGHLGSGGHNDYDVHFRDGKVESVSTWDMEVVGDMTQAEWDLLEATTGDVGVST